MVSENLMIEINEAKASVMANYPNDPLLKHIITEALDKLPKVEAAPVVHGYTLPAEEPQKVFLDSKCGICGQLMLSTDAFCSMCGAKMDGGSADDRT